MEGQSVGEHYPLSLQPLRGTYTVIRQGGLDLADPKLAAAAGISNNAAEMLWYDSIMKLTIHVFKDPRVGLKQVRYIESYIWIGKNKGVHISMDCLDILSTYLPLFLPLKGEVFKILSDQHKSTIVYNALPQ
jgi:hypothetical protein